MQHSLDVLDTFCQISVRTVRLEKTKMMAIKAIQPRHYLSFTYMEEPIQVVQSFKYLGINVHQQIGGMYAMSLDFKHIGIVIICSRINATILILEDGK